MYKDINSFKIDAKLQGYKSKIELNGEKLNKVRSFDLSCNADEATQLNIDFLVDDSIIEGEAGCNYEFKINLPDKVRRALYEQLKTEFEE